MTRLPSGQPRVPGHLGRNVYNGRGSTLYVLFFMELSAGGAGAFLTPGWNR
jgi:hypothetical protein